MDNVRLRRTVLNDLPILFEFQLDEEAGFLAAFIQKDFTDKEAYFKKHTKLLNNPDVNNQTILVENIIVGSIAKFELFGQNEITYWISRKYWGKGIATKALEQFLIIELNRPLFGRVAFDNIGSQKVLEKCGFVKCGTDRGFANARKAEIEEYIYQFSQ